VAQIVVSSDDIDWAEIDRWVARDDLPEIDWSVHPELADPSSSPRGKEPDEPASPTSSRDGVRNPSAREASDGSEEEHGLNAPSESAVRPSVTVTKHGLSSDPAPRRRRWGR
jgi:hypothetical protein